MCTHVPKRCKSHTGNRNNRGQHKIKTLLKSQLVSFGAQDTQPNSGPVSLTKDSTTEEPRSWRASPALAQDTQSSLQGVRAPSRLPRRYAPFLMRQEHWAASQGGWLRCVPSGPAVPCFIQQLFSRLWENASDAALVPREQAACPSEAPPLPAQVPCLPRLSSASQAPDTAPPGFP